MKSRHLFPLFLAILLNLAACLSARAVVPYDRINVTSSPYNAIPNDGISDKTAIDLAINVALPTPTPGYTPTKSIYFPPGTYIYDGPMNLPANTSFRLYGDGPGVSTIIFTGNNTAGISAPTMGREILTIEGLTLKAGCSSGACGTAIDAVFGPHSTPLPASVKFHTATIHNVQIIGSTRDGTSGSYWTNGIHLTGGANSVIDKVHISGNKNATLTGISLNPYPLPIDPENVTGFQLSNLEIKWCGSALRSNSWVEGIYLTGFEFTACGWGAPAIYLVSPPFDHNGGTVHLVNGKVDSVSNGITLQNWLFGKISNVSFTHTGPEAQFGTMLTLNTITDAIVSECTFYGVASPNSVQENGVYLVNAHSVRIAGNNFSHMQPSLGGSAIVVDAASNIVRITDNLFGTDVTNKLNNLMPPNPNDPYYNGNYPSLP